MSAILSPPRELNRAARRDDEILEREEAGHRRHVEAQLARDADGEARRLRRKRHLRDLDLHGFEVELERVPKGDGAEGDVAVEADPQAGLHRPADHVPPLDAILGLALDVDVGDDLDVAVLLQIAEVQLHAEVTQMDVREAAHVEVRRQAARDTRLLVDQRQVRATGDLALGVDREEDPLFAAGVERLRQRHRQVCAQRVVRDAELVEREIVLDDVEGVADQAGRRERDLAAGVDLEAIERAGVLEEGDLARQLHRHGAVVGTDLDARIDYLAAGRGIAQPQFGAEQIQLLLGHAAERQRREHDTRLPDL
jgi:hypothetical protein